MEINTEKYGPAGLPKFGPGYGLGFTAAGDLTPVQKTAIGEIDVAFNTLVSAVKKNCAPGNPWGLLFFGYAIKSVYGLATALVTEKSVANA